MRRAALRTACLLLAGLFLQAQAHSGFMPNRGKRKPRISGGTDSQASFARGPQYSQPDAPPTADQIPGLISNSDPNSPSSIAAESLGFQKTGDCNQGLVAQYQAILAQLQDLYTKEAAESRAISGCGIFNTACQATHAHAAAGYAAQAAVVAARALSLQGQAQDCSGGGSNQTQAQPPAVTLKTLANRLKVPLAGAPGAAQQQLKSIDALGGDAGGSIGFDGAAPQPKLAKALSHYGAVARRAGALGSRVAAGKQFAGKTMKFDDPAAAAQGEYLKINYKELGPKYEALQEERHGAAINVADQTVAGLAPPAPLPDVDAPALIQLDASKAVSLGGAGLMPEDAAGKAKESLLDGMKDAATDKLPIQWKSLEKIGEIELAVSKSWDLRDGLMDALREMGSGSLSTASSEKLLGQLDQYFGDVKDATFEKNPFKSLLGAD